MSVDAEHVVARAQWTATNSHPIGHAEIMVTEEAIIDRGNVGSPHQKHNAKMVELVAELCYRLAVITQEVEPRPRSTIQCNTC
jgi:predicted urease superfamily metal-dependent hydrolase